MMPEQKNPWNVYEWAYSTTLWNIGMYKRYAEKYTTSKKKNRTK